MVQTVDFDNGAERFNIDLDGDGNLNFNANANGGGTAGRRALVINDESGELTVGGDGQFGTLQLKDPDDRNTIFIGASGTTATALLGGGSGGTALNGSLRLGNSAGLTTVDVQGLGGNIFLGANPSGGAAGQDGDLLLRNGNGGTSIVLSGSNGRVTCVDLIETSDARVKKDVTPLANALDKIMALKGVRYQLKEGPHRGAQPNAGSHIGFIGQDVETVCPELVDTDDEGHKSLRYSRVAPILVEAIKEQQHVIREQASALREALQRITQIETALATKGA